MSNSNYTLEIISHHPEFRDKTLRKYYVDGIETIGAWGDEPFEIRFRNNTFNKVQVKLSLDGTDILTGNRADTEAGKDMWVVNAFGTLSLQAWPETNNGGAAFVFTNANNSVALHTHGDLSSRGIIAAAVFTEGYVEPPRYTCKCGGFYCYCYHVNTFNPFSLYKYGAIINNTSDLMSYNTNAIYSETSVKTKNLESISSLASVGAGQYVDQKISYTTGLKKTYFI